MVDRIKYVCASRALEVLISNQSIELEDIQLETANASSKKEQF
jgi:hypothetical protein